VDDPGHLVAAGANTLRDAFEELVREDNFNLDAALEKLSRMG
jgi:hypothetical protein